MISNVRIIEGDCVESMRGLPDASVDAVVTDPPYSLGFMSKEWDSHGTPEAFQRWTEDWAREAFRVLKPGGHLLSFCGTRTYHRMASGIEDAGFEIRDCIAWMYGSGFPKSLDVSKAIDKSFGVERTEVVGVKAGHEDFVDRTDGHSAGGREEGWDRPWKDDPESVRRSHLELAPVSPEAASWQGWGTALKPAFEPIVVARKPIPSTVAGNVLEYGTGALNIDGCRVEGEVDAYASGGSGAVGAGGVYGDYAGTPIPSRRAITHSGRWPANVVLDEQAAAMLDEQTGELPRAGGKPPRRNVGADERVAYGGAWYGDAALEGAGPLDDGGGPSRFFYVAPDDPAAPTGTTTTTASPSTSAGSAEPATSRDTSSSTDHGAKGSLNDPELVRFKYCAKVSRAEREAGLDGPGQERMTPMAGRGQPGLKCRTCGHWKVSGTPCRCAEPDFEQVGFEAKPLNWSSGEENPGSFQSEGTQRLARNFHPTVKPIALMRWLVRLVTPPGGTVLDPFLGSGSTGCAAVLEGFEFIGCEREPDYLPIAEARIRFWQEHGDDALNIVKAQESAEAARAELAATGQLDLFGDPAAIDDARLA